jgi:hypothetical protein
VDIDNNKIDIDPSIIPIQIPGKDRRKLISRLSKYTGQAEGSNSNIAAASQAATGVPLSSKYAFLNGHHIPKSNISKRHLLYEEHIYDKKMASIAAKQKSVASPTFPKSNSEKIQSFDNSKKTLTQGTATENVTTPRSSGTNSQPTQQGFFQRLNSTFSKKTAKELLSKSTGAVDMFLEQEENNKSNSTSDKKNSLNNSDESLKNMNRSASDLPPLAPQSTLPSEVYMNESYILF